MRLLLTFFFVLIVFSPGNDALSKTYYVDRVTGDDFNNGSLSSPWRTIQTAADSLMAGDTVFIKEGIYREMVIPKNSGESGKYIVYQRYVGNPVILDGETISLNDYESGMFDLSGKSYIKIVMLNVNNSAACGFYGDGSSNIILENCTVNKSAAPAISFVNSENILISNSNIVDVCLETEGAGIMVTNSDSVEISNNNILQVEEDGMYGIAAFGNCNFGKIHANFIRDTRKAAILLDSKDDTSTFMEISANFINGARGGVNIASSGGGLFEDVSIYNNLIFDCTDDGFATKREGQDEVTPKMNYIYFINNTLYNNGSAETGGGIKIAEDIWTLMIIRNNILSRNKNYQLIVNPEVSGNVAIDHNLFDGFAGHENELKGDDYVEGDPIFYNIEDANFYIDKYSPAVDEGSDALAPETDFAGIPRPVGDAVDIGAYENQSGLSVLDNANDNDAVAVYPNPFTNTAVINFWAKQPGQVKLRIFNITGKSVRTFKAADCGAGENIFIWDGLDDFGNEQQTGLYIYSLQYGNETFSGRIIKAGN